MFPKYELRNSSIWVRHNARLFGCPARFHKHIEMMFVKSGQVCAVIDGKSYTLSDGDVYLVFPNIVHALPRAEATIITVIFDNELCLSYHDILSRCKPEFAVLRGDEIPEFVSLTFDRLYELYQTDFPMKQTLLSSYVNTLLGEITGRMKLVERSSDNDLVQHLILYLHENYTGDISLEDVAKALNYSKYYISHVIAETFGCNFRPLINSFRIGMAQNLLLSTNKTVNEIAYECGFKNQSSFNRIFLKHNGLAPTVFRRQGTPPPEKPALYIKQ